MFWFSFGLCAVGGLLTLFFVPETPVRAKVSVDWLGAFLLTVALFTVMLALSLGAGWGWLSGKTVGTLAVTVVFAVAWVVWERRVPEPLISIDVLASRKVGITLLAGGIAYGATTLTATLIPMLLQTPKEAADYGFGLTVTDMALWMLPGGCLIVLGGVFVGATAKRIGFRQHLVLGAVLIALGATWLGDDAGPGVAGRVRVRSHRLRFDDLRRDPEPGDDGAARGPARDRRQLHRSVAVDVRRHVVLGGLRAVGAARP